MLITIATFLEPAEAHIVRGRLEAEGIPASIAHEGHVTANWTLATALGGVALQVSSRDAEIARALVDAYHRGEFSVDADALDPAATDSDDALPPVGPTVRVAVCTRCGSTNHRERVPLRQKLLAVGLFLFGGATFPTRSSALACLDCGHRWEKGDVLR